MHCEAPAASSLATNHAAATDGPATIADSSAVAISNRSTTNDGGATITDCPSGAVTDCSAADHSGSPITDGSTGGVTDCSTTDYGPTAIADSSAAAISDRSTSHHGGTTVGDCPEWIYVTRMVHAASTNKCARFHAADGNQSSDKTQDYDRISHALPFRASCPFECLR
jgi:hypothetical protein